MNQISLRLSHYFPLRARQMGFEVYRHGDVQIGLGGSDFVDGTVKHSPTVRCEASLGLQGGDLVCRCSFAACQGKDLCLHLWAMVLQAEQHNYLSGLLSLRALRILPSSAGLAGGAVPPLPSPARWQSRFQDLLEPELSPRPLAAWPSTRRVVYGIDLLRSIAAGTMVLQLGYQDGKRDGAWGSVRALSLRRDAIALLPADDAEILAAIGGGEQGVLSVYGGFQTLPNTLHLSGPLALLLAPRILRTGRCVLNTETTWKNPPSLSWDEGDPWQFRAQVAGMAGGGWSVRGLLRRGEGERREELDAQSPDLITRDGFVVASQRVARVEAAPISALLHFHQAGAMSVPQGDRDVLLTALFDSPLAPHLDLPEEMQVRHEIPVPTPHLAIHRAERRYKAVDRLEAELSFDYGSWRVEEDAPQRGHLEIEAALYRRRDSAAERAACDQLIAAGFRFRNSQYGRPGSWELAPAKLPRAARALLEAGWQVEAHGKLFRRPGEFRLAVASGVDWFELHGEVAYGETRARLPALLAALRKGDTMVALDDGTYGMLPEEWLRSFGAWADLGTAEDGHLRFRPSQAGLLDALLATQPAATCDAVFAQARRELALFQGVAAASQPAGFCGHLRDYQREGLGWLLFLRRFGFGGCLADDMGVGKTAQALALLETRRAARAAGEPVAPALIVAPRSLIFNWKEEAARFTPQLRLLDFTGAGRTPQFGGYDAVLTTYGTLRREVLRLKQIEFDLIVLDEAQAIKNASTDAAKAARLLQGRQRLALSGTPIENHLGELWSLFEFLNPGMLGAASAFQQVAALGPAASGATGEPAHRAQLAQALRPFILRRTKAQVVRELPAKIEQTLVCEMKPAQRQLYDELRAHYRRALLHQVDSIGLAKSKIQVLEALLRLRQAACHPGLLDPKRRREPSAKLDALLEQLREVRAAGHKALVFSQFTRLLAILRERLDADAIAYEYLDGKTRDRKAPVERFQTDPDCPLFLISLKAGGLGLNLTAAEYVFLLDPWWNPAVEAQAVDRAHRIGQTRRVFAYRLIVRDSIEEKVLALQDSKRDLATALIGGGNSLMRDLRREDLEALLS